MRPFIVCIHDVTPAFAHEIRAMIDDLAPLVGRRLSCGVVPDWHGAWPLSSHAEFCRMVRDSFDEHLLHGYRHERQRGRGPVTWLTGGSDEMNGFDVAETRRILAQGQRELIDGFGQPARGFLAPAWQLGHAMKAANEDTGLEHALGFFSLRSCTGRNIPLATWTWDCGRFAWLGHVGHATGRLLQHSRRRVPVLAIHPNDLKRGYWPAIVQLTKDLLQQGYVPHTAQGLLEAGC